jgi:hypothetical protein
MAKGQKRGNREIRKPKAAKPPKLLATAGLPKATEVSAVISSRPRGKA